MYKRLAYNLLHTREDLTAACKLLNIDPEYVDVDMLEIAMCDECGYWDTRKRIFTSSDKTNFCFACHDLETRRF